MKPALWWVSRHTRSNRSWTASIARSIYRIRAWKTLTSRRTPTKTNPMLKVLNQIYSRAYIIQYRCHHNSFIVSMRISPIPRNLLTQSSQVSIEVLTRWIGPSRAHQSILRIQWIWTDGLLRKISSAFIPITGPNQTMLLTLISIKKKPVMISTSMPTPRNDTHKFE